MDIPNRDIVEKLTKLKDVVHASKNSSLERRLKENPYVTDLEYLLGAFLEMYEPHVQESVLRLSSKGYIVDASSGFSGKLSETQSLNGYLHPDYITRNKLEKIGIKFREFNGLMSFTFWPEEPNLESIKSKFLQIAEILPDKGILTTPSQLDHAVTFRMKYIPKDKNLQKKRLFERLLHFVQKQTENDFENRKIRKLRPDKTELCLGTFVEELEIQSREAVLMLNKKGYSIDTSGFMENPCVQMVEGDFQLDQQVIEKLKKMGVQVETNASGYTRIQFAPDDADLKRIIKQWMQIATLLPKKHEVAAPSMTRKARNFRTHYQN